MTRPVMSVAILAAIAAAAIGGYAARPHVSSLLQEQPRKAGQQASGPVIYYQDPDGKPAYSLTEMKTADGRAYRAVKASEDVSFSLPAAAQAPAAPPGKRVLYYRNPMGLADVSPTPKKDSMGMDYIPVYEGDPEDDGSVKISPAKIQRIGVTTEVAALRPVVPVVRAPGTIQLDEQRIAVITLRSEAFIESVESVTTGTEVRKGQPLFRIYSPSISAAAAEYVAIVAGRRDQDPGGARQRLLNLAVPDDVIAELGRDRRPHLAFTWTAPRDGIVLERNVSEGMRAMPGDVLFRIADHSVVWALVDVPEAQLASVSRGQNVIIRARAYPNRQFNGKVALVYPHLNAATRSVRVRIELPNHDLALLPDMYVQAEIDAGADAPRLAVPESAVIDSGDRQVVILDKGEGRFEPRAVRLGLRAGGFVEIRDGIKEGDVVVTSATFLIDAESNLKAALKAVTGTPQ